MMFFATIPLLGLLAITPTTAENSAGVTIEHVHTVFERKGANVEIMQSFQLGKANEVSSFMIPLPSGASGPQLMGDNNDDVELKSDKFIVKVPIAEQRQSVSVRYILPIRSGSMIFDQQLRLPVASAQAISTWTAGDVVLNGRGFLPPQIHSLPSGLNGLVISGHNISDGHLIITLSGLEDGPEAWRRLIALLLSVVLLAAGLLIWLKNKMTDLGETRKPVKQK
ncbi:MAG: hypothetical protein GY847_07440 [Proteobacteria bacterium]|nr:hypothetical protein [Pseudomonadota bacterium]